VNLTAIANAIRTQDGTSEPIPADTFAARIRALPQGVQLENTSVGVCTTQAEFLAAIADAIRAKEDSTGSIPAADFAEKILALEILEPPKAIVYHGTAAVLRQARNPAAAVAGDCAVFAGGEYNRSYTANVDGYDSNLTHKYMATMKQYRIDAAGVSAGGCALFVGGYSSSKVVDGYNANLSRFNPSELSTAIGDAVGASTPTHAVAVGAYNAVAYDQSITKTDLSVLATTSRYYLAGAALDSFAIFAGGYHYSNGVSLNLVDAYDASLSHLTLPVLSRARKYLSGAATKNHILFAGGYDDSAYVDIVDVYDKALTRLTPISLSAARNGIGATSLAGNAIFAGGYNGSSYLDVTDVFDDNLVRSTPSGLSVKRSVMGASATGNYAVFAGGSSLATVDVYTAQ